MIIVDSSAWIEYFRDGAPAVVRNVEKHLNEDLIGIGDLIYCEVLQGIIGERERAEVTELFRALPQFEMVGFEIAEQSASNYRLLRAKGVTVRKTIDVLIGTFCVAHDFELIHNDRDFDHMAKHIGLRIV